MNKLSSQNANIETRVKKYKQYRNKIKSDYSNFVKKSAKNDVIKKIEKKLAKIDEKLLIKDFESHLFIDFSNNFTNDGGHVISIKNYLDNSKNNNFSELLAKANSVKNEIDNEPSFDTKGNLSLIWYKQDSKFSELEKIHDWINLMVSEREKIVSNIKENIFLFKDALYKTSNRETVSSILPVVSSFSKVKVNYKNKRIYNFLLYGFFILISLAFLFIILFLIIWI
ncbi:MAG: hypothetical protein HUJ42_02125 [Malacoplasma sp.]|nr:hypothetical protein [Malacoplasma sp.]